jgi:superfamily II DNA or RNA helicase
MKVLFDYDSGRKKGVIVSDYLPNIREYFSVEDKNQAFRRRYAVGYRPPTRIYAITPQGRFNVKLVYEIHEFLKKQDIPFEINFSEAFAKACHTPPLDKKYKHNLKFELRDYQKESVETALSKRGGIIILPTSAGKTLVMASLYSAIQQNQKRKTLILVPDIQLVQQTHGDFIEYGIKEDEITKWTGSNDPNPDANILVANAQILLSKKQDLSVLKEIEVLIVDEVHKLKSGNEINKIINKIPAVYTYGLTGTLPDTPVDRWSIIGSIGPVIYTKKSIDLREQKFITDVLVKILKITYSNLPTFTKPSMTNPTAGYEEEIQFLQTNNFRNAVITKLINGVSNNILIMVDRIAHGEELLRVLSEHTTKQVYFVHGDVDVEEREKIRQLMETTDNVVCVAISKIFSTGINIKNLHYIVFAAIGKAKIKIIQSIGRSLRLHANKKQAVIFDIGDCLRYGNAHLEERLSLYENEKIQYNIININEGGLN